MSGAEIVVVGAGIVGAACAHALARDGHEVLVVDPNPGGLATAAGMGHVLVVEDDPALLRLTTRGRDLWEACAKDLPAGAQWERTGTLWVAEDEEDYALALDKAAKLEAAGVRSEWFEGSQLASIEPCLRPGLRGGLRIPGDRVLYPPVASNWLLQRAVSAGAKLRRAAPARRLETGRVELADGALLEARVVVNAAGLAAASLLQAGLVPALRARKGHLAITSAYPDFLHHQVVELGYLKSAASNAASSVAFNLQPRTTGQIIIGSSRQFGVENPAVERDVVARMLSRALAFVPSLAALDIVRTWAGFRAATADKRPLIGPVPEAEGVLLAAGHEGLGITTALSTAELIADHVAGRASEIDGAPFAVGRFSERRRASA